MRNADGDTIAQQSNIYCVDQAQTNTQIWYCGTETGEIYKSNNRGTTWTNVSTQQFLGNNIKAIKIDPTNEQVIYAGNHDFLFKSSDGGLNWDLSLSVNNLQVNEIFVHPNNSNIVLLASDAGVYRSIDGGTNWNQIYNTKLRPESQHSNPDDILSKTQCSSRFM